MNSTQLELDLFPGEPWNGRNPRELTRAHLGVIFKPRGAEDDRHFCDPLQRDLFHELVENVPPHVWGGTPSLLPLLERAISPRRVL